MKYIFFLLTTILTFSCVTGSNQKINTVIDNKLILRYAYKTGQTFNLSTKIDIDMKVNAGFIKQKMKMKMNMFALQKINSIDSNDNFHSTIIISRMVMEIKAGFRTIMIDTNDPKHKLDRKFKDLYTILNKPIGVIFTKRGKIIKYDYTSITEAFKGRYSAFGDKIKENLDQMMNNAMILFPEKAVTIGSIYEGGVISQKMQRVGRMNFYVKFKIVSIKDNVVYIKPIKQIELILEKAAISADIKDAEMDTLIKFDLKKGYITKVNDKTSLDLSIKHYRRNASIEMVSRSDYAMKENSSEK